MDPDETAPIGAVSSGSTRFVKAALVTFQQTSIVVIGTLKANTRTMTSSAVISCS